MFWHGFHARDRAKMNARLIAKHPDQPPGVPFDYLDVYRVARAILPGNDLSESDSDDSLDEPPRHSRLHHTRDRWSDQEGQDPQGADPNFQDHEQRRHHSPTNHSSHDSHCRRPNAHRSPLPDMETKVI